MDVKVVDASAIAALLFEEPEAAAIGGRLVDADLVAPVLLSTELAQVCRTKIRRNPSQQAGLVIAFAQRRRLRIEALAIDPDAVLDLALATGLTAYDASYLWLARDLGAELVTLDRQLAKAAAPI
jgi:predicted nucleic acid-binding protein